MKKKKKINDLRQSIYKVIGSLYDYLVEDNDRLSKSIHKLTHKELIEVKHAFESNNEGKKRAIAQQLSSYGLDPNNLYEVIEIELTVQSYHQIKIVIRLSILLVII